jgi:hypothetical protein
VSVGCGLVDVSATGRSLFRRGPTECGVSKVCDVKTSKMRRSRPTRAVKSWKGEVLMVVVIPKIKLGDIGTLNQLKFS